MENANGTTVSWLYASIGGIELKDFREITIDLRIEDVQMLKKLQKARKKAETFYLPD